MEHERQGVGAAVPGRQHFLRTEHDMLADTKKHAATMPPGLTAPARGVRPRKCRILQGDAFGVRFVDIIAFAATPRDGLPLDMTGGDFGHCCADVVHVVPPWVVRLFSCSGDRQSVVEGKGVYV